MGSRTCISSASDPRLSQVSYVPALLPIGNAFTDLVVFGVPEDDAVLWTVRFGEGVDHSVGAVAPLQRKHNEMKMLRKLQDMFRLGEGVDHSVGAVAPLQQEHNEMKM